MISPVKRVILKLMQQAMGWGVEWAEDEERELEAWGKTLEAKDDGR